MATEGAFLIKTDVGGIMAFQRRVKQMKRKGDSIFDAMFNQWSHRYRAYIKERWVDFSRGGGGWAPLAPSTVAKRRNNSDVILRDTGVLFRAIDPQIKNPHGLLEQRIPDGIRVGFGGGSHPTAGVQMNVLAFWHQTGAGNYPARPIIVDPDSKTQEGMNKDAEAALEKLSKATQIKSNG